MLNKLLFKTSGILAILLLTGAAVWAQKSFLKKLVPHQASVQHGGGIGFLAAGIGYINPNRKLEAELLYGYVPAGSSGVEIHSASIKLQWIPVKALHKGQLFLQPVRAGILVNHSFGKQYFGFKPDLYPYSYYNFPTSFNSAILFGSQAGINFSPGKKVNRLGLFYELLIFDRELISFVNNTQTIHFDDILTLGFGVKLYFR